MKRNISIYIIIFLVVFGVVFFMGRDKEELLPLDTSSEEKRENGDDVFVQIEKEANACEDGLSIVSDRYNGINETETTFSGVLVKNPDQDPDMATTLMRYMPFSLNGTDISTHYDLAVFIDKDVEITGKLEKFELEGVELEEIVPKDIRCR